MTLREGPKTPDQEDYCRIIGNLYANAVNMNKYISELKQDYLVLENEYQALQEKFEESQMLLAAVNDDKTGK